MESPSDNSDSSGDERGANIKGDLKFEQSHADTLSENQGQTSSASKKKPSSDRGHGSSSSRDSSEASAAQPEPSGISSNPSEGQRSDAGGGSYYGQGKVGNLGFEYELKLLMLLVKKAIDKNCDFLFATEMTAAEKFDDVVIKYEDQGHWTYRFLQAKHKLKPQKKQITVNDLTTLNDDHFSLQKYFISFCKIKGNPEFQGAELKDFVICTNTDFHSELLKDKEWKNLLSEGGLKKDDILYLGKGEKVRTLKDDSMKDIAEKIKLKLSLFESALKTKVIGNLTSAKEKLVSGKSVFYLIDLITKAGARSDVGQAATKILALKGKVLSDTDYKNLENAKKELDELKKESKKDSVKARNYEALRKGLESAKKKLDEVQEKAEAVEKALIEISEKAEKSLEKERKKLMEYQSKGSEKFEKLERDRMKLEEEKKKLEKERKKLNDNENDVESQTLNAIEKNKSISEIELIKVALEDSRFESEVKDFIKKFCFVTDYPGVDELNGIIKETFKNEMKPLAKELLSLKPDLLYASFEKGISDWFKNYKKGKRDFIAARQGAEFFKSIQKEINGLILNGLTKFYPEKLRGYGICFKSNLKDLEGFLSSEKQILHVSTQVTRLSAIMAFQTLKPSNLKPNKSDEFKGKYSYLRKEEGYIFIRLRHLLSPDTQKRVMSLFSSEQSHHLLVIECQDKIQDKIDDLYKSLSDNLYKSLSVNKNKRIILIAQDEDKLVGKFKDSHRDEYQKEYVRISFKDFDEDSQDKVLAKKVIFQGEEISLNQLIDKNLADGIIDESSLYRLVKEEKIPIGDQKALSSIGYDEDYYIERTLHRQRIKTEVLNPKKDKAKDLGLLFITGARQEDLTKLSDIKEDIGKWDGQAYGKRIILPSSGQGDQEIFQELCEKHPENDIHWLEHQKGKLTWRASKGHMSALKDHIDKNDVSDGNNALTEEYFSQPVALEQNVIILANDPGVGKSTVLTSLAHKMKQKDPVLWVVRVNLNDYAFDKKKLSDDDRRKNLKSLKEISFEKDNINEAIKFVSEMAVPVDSNGSDTQLQRKLFKTGLKNPKKADGQEFKKPKIVILFDGFDEISPTYKEKTNVLLKALKASKVTQLWITTRVHEKDYLEKELEATAYILNPLTEGDQEEFLNKFWRRSLKFLNKQAISGYKRRVYSKKLLKRWKESIGDTSKEFTQVPLNIRMLAEVVFEKKFQFEISVQKPKNLRLLNLYDEFIKVKLDIYKQEKAKAIQENQATDVVYLLYSAILSEIHTELALGELFKEKDHSSANQDKTIKELLLSGRRNLEKLKKKFQSIKKDLNTEIQRIGLIPTFLSDGSPRFIHRSFTEYFLSEYLIINLENKQVQKLLLKDILLKDDYTLIRKFFNGRLDMFFKYKFEREELEKQLTEGKISKNKFDGELPKLKTHHLEHLLNINLEKAVKECLEKSREENNHFLHIAASEDHPAIVKFLLGKLKDDKELQALMEAADEYGQTALHLAAEKGHTETVQTLLNGVKDHPNILQTLVERHDQYGRTALHLAAANGHTETVQALLDRVKDHPNILQTLVERPDRYGRTILHLAAGNGHSETMKALLDGVKDHPKILQTLVEQPNQHGFTTLHLAAACGRTETVQALLDGVKGHPDILQTLVERPDYEGLTALDLAVHWGRTETMQALLDRVKDHPNILQTLVERPYYEGLTVLDLAVQSGRIETMQALLDWVKKHPNILQKLMVSYEDGQTALQWAAKNGHTKTVLALLDGVKDNPVILQTLVIAYEDGQTVLHWAAENGHTKTVQALLNGVKNHPSILQTLVERPDQYGRTALHLAILWGCTETVKVLLEGVEDHPNILQTLVERPDQEGLTALDLAAAWGRTETVQALLDGMKDHPNILQTLVERPDYTGLTALNLAVQWGCIETMQALLHGVKDHPNILQTLVERPDQYGRTALHLAAANGHTETVQVLLDEVKDHTDILQTLVERPDQYGRTVLHLAAGNGHTETMKALLDGARDHPNILQMLVEQPNQHGFTTLHLAAAWGRTETVQALLDGVKDHPNILQTLVERPDYVGLTALDLAVQSGRTETMQALFDRVRDHPNILQTLVVPYEDVQTALQWAVENGHTKTVQALLDGVKDHPNILQTLVERSDQKGLTALNLAVQRGCTETMEALLDGVKDHPNILWTLVERLDEDEQTVLHFAAENGHTKTVQTLLYGVKGHPNILQTLVERPVEDGQTALHLAAENGHSETVQALLDGVKDHPNILQTLVERPVEDGQTALHLATVNGHTETVQALLDGVKDHPNVLQTLVERPDQYGRIALHLAVHYGRTETVQALLGGVKDHPNILQTLVERSDQYGRTALHLAAANGHTETVQALLDGMKDHANILRTLVEQLDEDGQTALHLAAENGHIETVQALWRLSGVILKP